MIHTDPGAKKAKQTYVHFAEFFGKKKYIQSSTKEPQFVQIDDEYISTGILVEIVCNGKIVWLVLQLKHIARGVRLLII